jgi:hypothetical protein
MGQMSFAPGVENSSVTVEKVQLSSVTAEKVQGALALH